MAPGVAPVTVAAPVAVAPGRTVGAPVVGVPVAPVAPSTTQAIPALPATPPVWAAPVVPGPTDTAFAERPAQV